MPLPTVKGVIPSEIWQRMKRAEKVLVEVPFSTTEKDGERPKIVSGIMDLVFKEKDSWVHSGNGGRLSGGSAKFFLAHSKHNILSPRIMPLILARYALPWEGTHGVPHWARVMENGRRLSKVTGAKAHVVELFAVFHDSQRFNEGFDDGHGRRGAELARELRGIVYEVADEDFDLLF